MEAPEIESTNIPNEITEVDFPEVGETTPHPQTSDPQAGTIAEGAGERKTENKIGFKRDEAP
jgi:hypothetical protein